MTQPDVHEDIRVWQRGRCCGEKANKAFFILVENVTIANMEDQGFESITAQAGERSRRGKLGGVPANALFVPVVIVLAILNIVIISLMVSMFMQSGRLSQSMQDSNAYITDATTLLAGSSVLSETSSNFVLMPITSKGELNVGPLNAYANELQQADHRGSAVVARFETYQVTDDVLQSIKEAAQAADALVDIQRRAIALVCAVYPLGDESLYARLDLPELSAADAALSDEEKIVLAQTIVLDNDWGENKSSVSSNVNGAVASMRAASGEQAAKSAQNIGTIRTLLCAVSAAIIVVLVIAFVLLYRMLISPLGKFSHLIVDGKPLDDEHGMHEIRLLAGSYNGLLQRRDVLEALLREAAETDVLTGMLNRYSLQQHLLEAEGKGYSLTVFLFDVDNLKVTNDTFGHAAGDDLIKRAAQCISACFSEGCDCVCYRLAGDEFLSVARNLDPAEIPALATRFEELQRQYDVSISWGYAHAVEIGDTSFRILMDQADQSMYQMKEGYHRVGYHAVPF